MSQESRFDLYEYIELCLLKHDLDSVDYIWLENQLCRSCQSKQDVDKQLKKLLKKIEKEKNE